MAHSAPVTGCRRSESWREWRSGGISQVEATENRGSITVNEGNPDKPKLVQAFCENPSHRKIAFFVVRSLGVDA